MNPTPGLVERLRADAMGCEGLTCDNAECQTVQLRRAALEREAADALDRTQSVPNSTHGLHVHRTRDGAGDLVQVCDPGGAVVCWLRSPYADAYAPILAAAPALLAACEAFAEQWVKLAGFPMATDPYSGAIVAVRAALAKARA